MCKIGDIILINGYNHNGLSLQRHSFIVLSTEAGVVRGMEYDLVCNVMSSFKSKEQKEHKLSYPGNLEISREDSNPDTLNDKEGYVKADQFYYFDKSELSYTVIGNVTIEFFSKLIEYIKESDFEIKHITSNLQKTSEETA